MGEGGVEGFSERLMERETTVDYSRERGREGGRKGEEREREALQQFGAFSYPNHRNGRGSRNNRDSKRMAGAQRQPRRNGREEGRKGGGLTDSSQHETMGTEVG